MIYKSESRNSRWAEYVNHHLTLNNQRSSLNISAEELGHNVSPWIEYEKFGHLLNNIANGILGAIKKAIISKSNGLCSNFAK